MTPYRNTQSRSMTYKYSLAIVPDTSTTSPSLPKSYFDHLHYKIQTMNENIQNEIKVLTDSITDILQKLTDGSSKTENYDEKITDISSKISDYE